MKEKEDLLSEREAEIVGYRERLNFLLENKGEIKELRSLLANLRDEEEEEEGEEDEDEAEEGNDDDNGEGEKEDKGEEETKEEHDDDNLEEENRKKNQNESEKSVKEKTDTASMSLQLPDRGTETEIGVSVGTNTSLTNSTDMDCVGSTVESGSSSALLGLSPLLLSALLTPPRTKVLVPVAARAVGGEDRECGGRGGEGTGVGEGRGGGQGQGQGGVSRGDIQYTQSGQAIIRPSSKETAVTGWHTRELL